jgi:hypothetical protein
MMDYYIPVDYDNRVWWASTNGHEIIMIRSDKIVSNNEQVFEFPPDNVVDIARVLPEFIKVVGILDLVDFMSIYSNIPLVEVPLMIECEACDGNGKFDHYGEEYDCKSCEETGKVSTKRMEKIKDPDYLLNYNIFNSQYFSLKRIYNTVDTIKRINPKEVKILETKFCLFLALDELALIYVAPDIECFYKKKILEFKLK